VPVLYAGANEGRWRLVANGRPGPECDAWLYQTACGPDRTGIAYAAVEISRKAFVSIDGQAGPVWDDVSCPVLSDDRKRLAYVACKGRGPERKEMPVIDGKQGPEYDQVAPDSLAFDSSGRRVAYAARSGQKWRVVIDGQPGPQYDRIGEGPIIFLSDGKAVTYAAMAERKCVVVIGDQPGAAWDEIAGLTSSAGGRHVAYAARLGAKWRAVVDGQAGPEYDQIGLDGPDRFWFSRDGGRVAYAARLGQKWQVVVDGLAGAACDEVREDSAPAAFSPDGKHTAYVARSGAKWRVVIDGQPGLACDEIAPSSLEFGDDGPRSAYAARRGGKWLMVIDGRCGAEFDQVDVSSRVFSMHGSRAAYAARRGHKWRVVVNGQEGPEYEDVSELLYSPDGRRMAYVATDKGRGDRVVLDGEPGPWFDRVGSFQYCGRPAHATSAVATYRPPTAGKFPLGHDNIYSLAFSPDGKRVAYTVGDRAGTRVVLDGKAGPTYPAAGTPMFSPDGKQLAYVVSEGRDGRSRQRLVIDGQAGPFYDKIELPGRPGLSCFTPDGNHTVYAARNGTKWRVVMDGKEGSSCDAFFGPQSVTSYGRRASYASWRWVLWQGYKPLQFAPDYRAPDFGPVFFGGDGGHVACAGIVETRARSAVVVDGQAGPRYDQVSKPVVSPDGRRVGYIACRDKGQERKFLAVIDGREGPECDEIPMGGQRDWEPFSPDSTRTAYLARIGQKWHVVADGQVGPEYERVRPASVGPWGGFFSPDGKRMAFLGKRDGKWRAMIDGREGPEFDDVGDFRSLEFSPDNKRVAYMGKRNGKWRAVIDGREGPEYDLGWTAGVIFSPDSRRTAYVGGRGERQFVVLDGKELASHDAVDGIRIQFSPDSRRVAYMAYRGAKDNRKAHFVIDGQEGPERGDGIYNVYFSPDSRHVAYIAIIGNWTDSSHTERMVVDGNEGPEVDRVEDSFVRWSPDSRHLAYTGKWGSRQVVVVDGQMGPVYAWVRSLEFSPDSKHMVYVPYKTWGGQGYLVVRDGQAGRVFDDIETFGHWSGYSMFTPDSGHVVYQARRGGKESIVVDDQPGPEYDSVLCTRFRVWAANGRPQETRSMCAPRFLPDGAVQYPAFNAGKPGELYIVTQW
jgi:Tol biopolymer transport system component